MTTIPVDKYQRELEPGQVVARAYKSGMSCFVELIAVREIKNGAVYLGTSKVPLVYPSRLIIVNDLNPALLQDIANEVA